MNSLIFAVTICIGITLSTWVQAEITIVNVKKVEQDMYQTSDGKYIETSSCLVEANGERAVLDYVKYSCNNNLQFGPDKSCKVQFVFK